MEGEINNDIIVLMSTYNGAKYLNTQIDSIYRQKEVNVHLIIRDDFSNDNGETVKIINSYKDKFPNSITIIEGKSNIGYANSFIELIKFGIKKFPNSKYFSFADQDDEWCEDKLITGINKLKNHDNTIPLLYCSNTELVDINLKHIGYYWTRKNININKEQSLIQSFAIGCTCIFNKEAASLCAKRFSSPPYPAAHDYFLYQTCVFFGKVIWDSNAHIKYRQHGNNMIGCPNLMQRIKKKINNSNNKCFLEKQAQAFYEIYKDILSKQDQIILHYFINYKKNYINKFKILFNRKYRHTDFLSRVNIYYKILLGLL